MGELSNYVIEDKEKLFCYSKIRNAKEFCKWYKSEEDVALGNHFIYKGVNEAKYKLYTSSQRIWWILDLIRYVDDENDITKWGEYYNFLNLLITNAKRWNDGILERYYKKFDVELNDFALLSLMQHYKLPTPLIDFTTDQDIALYFAFHNMVQNPKDLEIDNYVSLYTIDLNQNQERLINLYDIYQKSKNLDFKTLYDFKKMFYFSEFNEMNTSQDIKVKTYIDSNLNIINQKGVFLFNHHPWLPLDMKDTLNRSYPRLKEIKCIDIHKSIKEFVLYEVKKKNKKINKNYLFPNYNHFKEKTLKKTLQQIHLVKNFL